MQYTRFTLFSLKHDNPLTLEPVNDSETATESDGRHLETHRTTMSDSHTHTTLHTDRQGAALTQRRNLSTSSQRSQPSSSTVASGPVASSENPVVHKYMFSTPIYPHLINGSQTCHDLTYLPKPRGIYPSGDLPWVYRHKVKRSMNELSKIMSSKVVLADTNEYQLPF